MVLVIDNYDSFTYNLCDYIAQLGHAYRVVRNNEVTLQQLKGIPFTSAVISPGPETPAQAGITLPFIQAYHQHLPILGVCLGHQALGVFFGAQLVKAAVPMHGHTSVIQHNGHWLFNGIGQNVPVMRYHSLILQGVNATPLQTVAHTPTGEVMAVAHPTLPLAGLQFHPESILTPSGLLVLQNWFNRISS